MAGLEETALAGADTRPALVKYVGMPMTMAVVLLSTPGMIMGLMGDWHYRIVGFVLWAIACVACWSLVRYDHNAPRIARLWLQSKALSLENHKWSGATIEPFPLRRSKSRGIP